MRRRGRHRVGPEPCWARDLHPQPLASYCRTIIGNKRKGLGEFTPGVSEHTSATTFSHQDQLGSNVAQTNSSQSVTATQQYDAFGLLVASSGTQVGPFGFVGKEGYQTDASGLMLLGHRYYDPSTGRFLTRDPAKFGKNWYGYCDNRPLCLADSAGLDWGPRWKKAPPILSAALAGGLYMLAIEGSVGLMLCALASALFAGGILLIRRKTADAPE